MQQIAQGSGCSLNKVAYWMSKHKIQRRSISEAIYRRRHPAGDPFKIRRARTAAEARLVGLGIGLYWGEGTKANRHAVRLGNTDPDLLRTFILFLTRMCGVKRSDLRFGLQLFSDIDSETALYYWGKQLKVKRSQFYKVIVTPSGSLGTYRKKSPYGVITVYYTNKKLRDILVASCRDSSAGRAHSW